MSYTVKQIDDKWWVVEFVGVIPKIVDPEFPSKLDKFMSDNEAPSTKYPTLPEHAAHWQALEGKELEEGSFEVGMVCPTRGVLCEGTCSNCSGVGMIDLYAIPLPQPNEDEVWSGIAQALQRSFGVTKHQSQSFIYYLKQHYQISKK